MTGVTINYIEKLRAISIMNNRIEKKRLSTNFCCTALRIQFSAPASVLVQGFVHMKHISKSNILLMINLCFPYSILD